MPFGIGPLELIIVLVIILLIFGGRKLPEMGRSLGTGMREFKKGVSGEKTEGEAKDQVTAAQASDPSLPQPQKTDETTPAA